MGAFDSKTLTKYLKTMLLMEHTKHLSFSLTLFLLSVTATIRAPTNMGYGNHAFISIM